MVAINSQPEKTILDIWCEKLAAAGIPQSVGARILDSVCASCPIADLEMSEHQIREVATHVLQAVIEVGLARVDGARLAHLLTDLEKGAAYYPKEMERLRDRIIAIARPPEAAP